MNLKQAYLSGARGAYMKYANPMGADYGVRPKGPEVSHGTELIPYNKTEHAQKAPWMSDQLWDIFGKNKEAPGRASGEYGAEVIG